MVRVAKKTLSFYNVTMKQSSIISFLKQYRWEIAVGGFLITAYLATRLYNLLLIPIFTDEAIYVRWAQIARFDAGWRFISLTDGKQPSFVWATMVVMRFVQDPLLAGRLVSVGAGLATMVGLFFLGRELFRNRWIGFTSAGLYFLFPIALIYDRMALYEGLVGMFTVWSLYLAVCLVRSLGVDIALILGMAMGGGLLTKSSAFFNIYLLPFTLLLFDWSLGSRSEGRDKSQKQRWPRFFQWAGLVLIAVILAQAYYSILRLSPFFHIIGEKNTIFIYPISEWRVHPFEFFRGNLAGLWDWFVTYLTWPQVILIGASFLVFFKFTKEKILLFAWFSIPFVALALFGRILYPRFIFFMILPLLPLAALSLSKIYAVIKNKLLFASCLLLFAVLLLRADYFILTNPTRAPIPKLDLEQYLNGWPAGGGIKEVMGYLGKQAANQKIYVATEGTFGSLPTYAVEIYLGDNKNVDKRGIWPLPKEFPPDLLEKVKVMPVYFIFNQTQEPPSDWPLKLIARYQKGVGNSYLRLYQILSEK